MAINKVPTREINLTKFKVGSCLKYKIRTCLQHKVSDLSKCKIE